MWRHSISSASYQAKAKIGGLFKSLGLAKDSEVSEDEYMAEAETVFESKDFEAHTVETKEHETAKIFVSRSSETAYFEEAEEFTPTIISAADKVIVSEVEEKPVLKKEKIKAAEPADLFINALRKPTRQSFDRATPRIKASAPAPVVEAPAKKAEEVVPEKVEPVISAPAVPATPVVEEVKVTAEAIVVPAVEPVVTEAPAVQEIAVETAAIEVPVQVEPTIVAPVVEEAEPAVIEAPVQEEPVIEAPVVEEAEPALVEELEIAESKVEHEVAVEAAIAAEEEFVAAQAEEASEPVAEPAPVLALPASNVVVPALPARIEVPALEAEEESESDMIGFVAPAEDIILAEPAETSAEAYVEPVQETEVFAQQVTKTLPVIVLNESRDLLFAFNNELEADEIDFMSTSMDDNLAFSEDLLDEEQFTFKMRVSRPRFDGNFRSLAY